MSAAIGFSDVIGRRVRVGDWQDQTVSTYRRIHAALDGGAWDEAAELAEYFVDEAKVCWVLYRQWIRDIAGYLATNGVSEDDLAAIEEQIAEASRLPDGSPFDSDAHWARFTSLVEDVVHAARAGDATTARRSMDEAKEVWRQTHDRDVDHTYGLMAAVKTRLGEDHIRPMYDVVLLPLFAWRYEKFDIDKHPWDEALETLLYVAIEAMRGHLVGPERTGDMELVETDDRYILRFDPCGSGQRTVRGDWVEGTPPRMEPPYGWPVSEEPQDWNHGTPGVCLYCAHCIVLMELMPMDRFGYPVRVVDPPVYPDTDPDPGRRQRCQWQIFKDPTAVPAELYERAGRTKPAVFGSEAHGAEPLPDAGSFGMPGVG
ncbi:MAG: hypothetical protein AVDCRST_MAG79-1268 [uncultured Thermoleophilia bacterium]|uniref:Uncharacterized protein n=1 Tax=uncultured Thermoleophilia bacterium TaxID=1497501 RepID=A0A6J4TXH5_9ACTN|nr:MAG: hypothetical protein AVDCRST_MAG79-1268 [uncultured Thermoleophilia bacterium]